MADRPLLEPHECMRCRCGSISFNICIGARDVECICCGQSYHLGEHLFSGCAEGCGMMYPYEQDPEDGEWYWYASKGAQDWTKEQKTLSPSGYLGNDLYF